MRCGFCGGKSVVCLKYFSQALCGECFTRLFEGRVRKTIRVNRLLPSGGRVAVAVSGGKDSMSLLRILRDLTSRNPKLELTALVVDEGIKGKKKALKGVLDYCGSLGVEHRFYSFREEYGLTLDSVMRKMGGGGVLACTYCGVLRRRLLNSKALELGVLRIATGHNLDDEIQSSMMNFMRGEFDRMTRQRALVGVMRDRRFVPRIKPLRECPEEEVALYARLNKIPVVSFACPHAARGTLRRNVKDVINRLEARHPGTKFQMLASTDKLVGLLQPLYAGEKMEYCVECGDPSTGLRCRACEILDKLNR